MPAEYRKGAPMIVVLTVLDPKGRRIAETKEVLLPKQGGVQVKKLMQLSFQPDMKLWKKARRTGSLEYSLALSLILGDHKDAALLKGMPIQLKGRVMFQQVAENRE